MDDDGSPLNNFGKGLRKLFGRGKFGTGEDVTENLKTLRNIPHKIENAPERLIVRGEVYMAREVFLEQNRLREISGETPLANPRNAAAGSMRQLDPAVTRSRQLDIVIFNIQQTSGSMPASHAESLDYLKALGFPVVPHFCYDTIEDCCARVEALG